MSYLAINLNIQGRKALCAGDGDRLMAKAERLWEGGATVYWLDSTPEAWQGRSRVQSLSRDDLAAHAKDLSFALLALADSDANGSIEELCPHAYVWREDAAEPALQFPSLVRRGPLTVAVHSGGGLPTVARWVRQRLEQVLPAGLGALLDAAGRLLPDLAPASANGRRQLWHRLLSGHLAESASQIPAAKLEAGIREAAGKADGSGVQGRVFLVGAGPGDPELLTLKALRLIGEADVVLYDRLVSDAIMSLVRADAEKIHVGKARANHSYPQTTINQMLVDQAMKGRTVVRLKGGDPFIFGRGGEEIETLAEAGIGFEVVPGITAASGCSAYAGIPLTHRDYAQSVRFVTGHLKNNTADLPWHELIHSQQTLVIYMGLVGLPIISQQLMAHGMPPSTPIALVSRGTLPGQQVVSGTLENIVERVSRCQVKAPTLVVVGDVVLLRDKLDWIGQRGVPA